jgi:hypothetical protein
MKKRAVALETVDETLRKPYLSSMTSSPAHFKITRPAEDFIRRSFSSDTELLVSV